MEVIIKDKRKYGKSRLEIEENLRKDGLRSLSDEHYEKLKFINKKAKEKFGTDKAFFNSNQIESMYKEKK